MQLQLMHKGRLAIYADIMYNACERKKRLARIGIRRPNSQLGPALRLTTGSDNFYTLVATFIPPRGNRIRRRLRLPPRVGRH